MADLEPKGDAMSVDSPEASGKEEEEGSSKVLVKDVIHDGDHEEDNSEENQSEDQPEEGEDVEEIHPVIISLTTVPIQSPTLQIDFQIPLPIGTIPEPTSSKHFDRFKTRKLRPSMVNLCIAVITLFFFQDLA